MSVIKDVHKNNARFNMQHIFDKLYAESSRGWEFKNLYELIISENNIKLAYRNIRGNKGSKTPGTDKKNIKNIGSMEESTYVTKIIERMNNYNPQSVRRVFIKKENGKLRPLGIPTMEDRLIQQCFKQILEPICEAKFHNHSYGFRPNRSCNNAHARFQDLINRGYHYVVDVDIKGFFDNINHTKLKKQIWSLGIHDKKVISIIGKMLKAPVLNEGIPTKGTPQGGILSPLLSNIVLNEFDWWISNQWETSNKITGLERTSTSRSRLRKSKLKRMYIVRYADDFKILCNNYVTAKKIFFGVKQWLKERLDLDISPEKSKVTNLKRNSSNFLGLSCRAFYKANKRLKWVCKSEMSKKCKESLIKTLREQLRKIQQYPNGDNALKYNQIILGTQNYYKMASNVNPNFSEIEYRIKGSIINLEKVGTYKGAKDNLYERLYGKYKTKTMYIQRVKLFLVSGVINTPPTLFSQEICEYTKIGRNIINDKILYKGLYNQVYIIMQSQIGSTEYNNNRASLFLAQKGKCAISELPITKSTMDCHHIIPKEKGGKDDYSNLILLHKEVHKLIHMTNEKELTERIKKYNVDIKKLNKYRLKAEMYKIS